MSYPDFIKKGLPRADVPFDGIRAWLSQGSDHQITFVEADRGGLEIPAHHHGDQWGIVVEGRLELTVEGDTRVYRAGDSFMIPAGKVHSARFLEPSRVIDVFADADRFSAR